MATIPFPSHQVLSGLLGAMRFLYDPTIEPDGIENQIAVVRVVAHNDSLLLVEVLSEFPGYSVGQKSGDNKTKTLWVEPHQLGSF